MAGITVGASGRSVDDFDSKHSDSHARLATINSSRYLLAMETTATQASQTLADLIEQVGRTVHGDGFRGGLNPAQWAALRYVARANRFSRTVSAFASFHGSTRGTASQTVKSLVHKNLLRRQPVDGDRRSFRLELTEDGRRLLEQDPARVLARAADGLPPEMRQMLADGLGAVLQTVLELQGRPRFGVCACCCHLKVEACPGGGVDSHLCGLWQERLTGSDVERICTNYHEVGDRAPP